MILKKSKRVGNDSLEVSEIANSIDLERLAVGTCWADFLLSVPTMYTHHYQHTKCRVGAQGTVCQSVEDFGTIH